MNLPIPSHLKGFLSLDDKEQTEYEVSGSIKCKCGAVHFVVFSSNDRQIVKVKCPDCGEEILLFDAGKHGWDGFVCKDDFLDREEPLIEYSCENCGDQVFRVELKILSQGKQDFIDECVSNDDSFSEEEWVDAFEWINIRLICESCNSAENDWLDLETM